MEPARPFLHRLAMDEAFVELRAGEFAAAARMLEDAWRGLEQVGEHGFRSTIGTLLAESLAGLGRIEEAEELIEASERLAEADDAATDDRRRSRSRVRRRRPRLARRVDRTRRGGRARADATDYLDERAELYLHLGETLIAAAQADAAADPLREAIALADRKGSTVLADRARTLLADHQ